MMREIRSFSRSPWALGIFGILAVALVVTMGDPFTGAMGGGFVRAGDRELNIRDVNRSVDQQIEAIRLQSGDVITRQQAAEQGIVSGVLTQLIEQTFTLGYADKLGVRASPKAVSDFLINDAPRFKDALGRVDMAAVAQFAGERGLTLRQFQDELKDSLTYEYMRQPQDIPVSPPDILTRPMAMYFGEKRSFLLASLSLNDVPPPAEPTDAEIEKFYADNQSAFAVPERRRISVISYSPADYTDRVAVTPEQIKAEYDRRIREFSTAETREITQVSSTDRNAVQSVVDTVKQGVALTEALTRATGVDSANISVKPTDLTDEQYSQFVFSLPQGETVGPVQVGQSWYAVQVNTIVAGVPTPLEQLTEKLRGDIAQREASRLFNDSRETFEILVGQGSTMEEISTELGAPLIEIAPVDPSGALANGQVVELLTSHPETFAYMFEANVNDTSEVIEGEGERIAMRLDEVVASTTRPLADVRANVRLRLIAQKTQAAAKAVADDVVAKGTTLDALRAAAEAAKMRVIESPTFSRAEQPPLPPELVQQGFSMALDQTAVVDFGGEPQIIRVLSIQPVGEETDAQLMTQVDQIIAESLARDLREAFGRAIQKEISFNVNQKAIQDYLASFTPEEAAP